MTLYSHLSLNTVLRVELLSADALVLRHDCFKIDGYAICCQRQGCRRSPRSVVSDDIRLMPIFVGVRWWDGVNYESAVVENASFLLRSLYLPNFFILYKGKKNMTLQYEVPHWLYISKFTRLCAVSWRQHGSCLNCRVCIATHGSALRWSELCEMER